MSKVSVQIFKSRTVKPTLFSALAALLVWEVTSKTFAAFLGSFAPAQALHVQSRQTEALLNLAQTELGVSEDKQARGMVERALLGDPLNAQALRILGQIAELSKDRPRSWQFMQAAVHRSLNESLAVGWLMYRSAEERDYAGAMYYADVLLRTRPQLGIRVVIPILARIAEDKDAVVGLKAILSGNPPWRALFFDALPANITDVRIPLDLLMALKHSPVPPTNAELRGYVNFLIGRGFYGLAYYTWLQHLPPDQLSGAGFVFNGGFETVPSGLPFDWSITPGAGAAIDIDTPPDGDRNRALFVRMEGDRVEFGRVAEVIMLAPAKYRFEATYKGSLLGQRGLRWRITCMGGAATPLGESEMLKGTIATWKTTEFLIDVPSSACIAQYVHLDFDTRMASEQFASGEVWFDDIRISRLGDGEP